MFRRLIDYLLDAFRRPRVELTRRQRQLRYSWELIAHCWRVLIRLRAEGMAAELTYRTIFSLIPLVVLGLVTFRIFGGLNDIESRVAEQMYSFFGVPEVPVVAYADDLPTETPLEKPSDTSGERRDDEIDQPPGATTLPGGDDENPRSNGKLLPEESADPDGAPNAVGDVPNPNDRGEKLPSSPAGQSRLPGGPGGPAALDASDSAVEPADDLELSEQAPAESPTDQPGSVDTAAERQQVQASIRWALRELTSKVSQIDFASIGVFGLILFIYAAIALADSVESVFNLIYSAPSGRPVHLRIAIHWSIITLGSGLLAMSLYMSGQLVDYVSVTTGWSVTSFANHTLALLSGWVLLFLLYALMPNTRVSLRAAAIGSFVAALLWEFAKFGFQVYVSKAVPYSALYGSLGLIPLFLFWVYVTWFIILFGLVWTYTLQSAPGHVPSKEEDEKSDDVLAGDPQWLLLVMMEAVSAYREGEAIGREQLRSRLQLPTRFIQPMIELLERAQLLRRVDSEQANQYVPARPAEQMAVGEILQLGRYEPEDDRTKAWERLLAVRQEEESDLKGRSLADLVDA